jgi:PPM family protein phosphatase
VAWSARVETEARLEGSGATLVTALRTSEGIALAHLGDCAALLLRQGTIVRRTLNHTLVRDYVDATGDNSGEGDFEKIVVRAVGMTREPEVQHWDVSSTDIVALTAGVHDLLSDAEVEALFCTDPAELARRLVNAPGAHGPKDDIAVLTFSING